MVYEFLKVQFKVYLSFLVFNNLSEKIISVNFKTENRERSGSVVECLTRD